MERWSPMERAREATMIDALDRACRLDDALERRASAQSQREYARAGAEVENARAEIRRFRVGTAAIRPARIGAG
jgi:hypothetical protein